MTDESLRLMRLGRFRDAADAMVDEELRSRADFIRHAKALGWKLPEGARCDHGEAEGNGLPYLIEAGTCLRCERKVPGVA